MESTTGIYANLLPTGAAALEDAVYHLGLRDTDLLERMVTRGPGYLHAAAEFESSVIAYNLRYPNLTQPLVFVFPADGTFWMDSPLCTLDSVPWTTPLDVEAGQLFSDFVTSLAQVL